MKSLLWLTLAALLAVNARACIWDADSLWHEKLRSHDLASAILGEPPAAEDTQKLHARITDLEAHRHEASAEWWNNLAGAYLRLNQPAQAAKILEPVIGKFPNDYGLHANLGTAYHLLGRYAEAEKEIARDLEINPDAHFGLEKYHLALLQYLLRDAKYQSRHVYVDEFTESFFMFGHGRFFFREPVEKTLKAGTNFTVADTNMLAAAEADYESVVKFGGTESAWMDAFGNAASLDAPPAYRFMWNLAADTNLEAGIIYMAQMNPKEPACFTMLGIVAWQQRNYHLAVSAFQKSVFLSSPQSKILQFKITGLNDYILESAKQSFASPRNPAFPIICAVILLYLVLKIFAWRRRAAAK